jgi:hypothetical protein
MSYFGSIGRMFDASLSGGVAGAQRGRDLALQTPRLVHAWDGAACGDSVWTVYHHASCLCWGPEQDLANPAETYAVVRRPWEVSL